MKHVEASSRGSGHTEKAAFVAPRVEDLGTLKVLTRGANIEIITDTEDPLGTSVTT